MSAIAIDKAFNQDSQSFHYEEFDECQFENCKLSGYVFSDKKFIDCQFTKCDFSNTKITDCVFNNCDFIDCKIMGVNWSLARKLSNLNFQNCLLNLSVMMNLEMPDTKFKGCQLEEVDFSESNLKSSSFEDCLLHGAIFRNTNLQKCDFTTAKNYQINILQNSYKDAKFSLPEAISLLTDLGIKLK